jgi:membrane protease YdiL (CAAX protease family)
MRASAWFLGVLLLAAVILGTVAYPVYEFVSRLHVWPFHRVYGRLAMLVVVVLLAASFRLQGIRTKRDFGFGLPWRRFLRVALLWSGAGIASAAAGAAFIWAAGLRGLDPQFVMTPGAVLRVIFNGIGSGIAVALFEETLARGAVHTAIARESGAAAAAFVTATLFAILHFFAKASIPADALAWRSGFDLLARSFAPLGCPACVLDSFLAYFAIGLVLSLTRVLTGAIAVAVGLHAGWVLVLRIMQQCTVRTPSAGYDVWLGRFDGLVGYWMLPWAAAIGIALWLTRARWVPAASPSGLSVARPFPVRPPPDLGRSR